MSEVRGWNDAGTRDGSREGEKVSEKSGPVRVKHGWRR